MYDLIVNPVSGSGRALKITARIEAFLKERKIDYRISRTECPGHATQLAKIAAAKDDCTAVIAVGGDGLCYEVACGLSGSEKPLGIIPAGTGNDFVKTIGIPLDPEKAMDFILNHQPRLCDFGLLNDGHFLNVCGTGFDVEVLDQAARFKKLVRGLLPYLMGVITAIFTYKPVHLKIEMDGETEERDVLVCSVANGRFIGGGIPICPKAAPDDGLLDVVIARNVPRIKLFRYLPGLVQGKILKFDICEHRRCRHVVIESPAMRLNCDGQIFSMDRAEFGVQHNALRIYRA